MTENNRILIIDDDPGVRDSYKEILSPFAKEDVLSKGVSLFDRPKQESVPIERKKYDLTMAESGEEGVKAVEEATNQKKPFAVAFIDMKMPGMDGAVLDIGEGDRIIGIEILDASRHVSLERLLPVKYEVSKAAV